MAKDKIKTWEVVRIVKEVYEVEATNREQAIIHIGVKGDAHTITVIKETAKIKKP